MRTRLGAPKAITAAAHKLARIVFHLLTTKHPTTNPSSPNRNCKTINEYNKNLDNRPKNTASNSFQQQSPNSVVLGRDLAVEEAV
jgi:hypothetical protein